MRCIGCGTEYEGTLCPNCGIISQLNDRMVTLTITRKKKIMGFAMPFEVFVDNNRIGSIDNGDNLSCQIKEGVHKIIFKCADKNVEQDIEVKKEHNSVEVMCHTKMGLGAGIIKVDNVIYR